MFISPKWAAIMAAPFALICLGFAVHGFVQTGEITDPQQLADARGYVMFWLFLFAIAVASGVLSWWLMAEQQKRENADS